MKKLLSTVAAFALLPAMASALGLDRSGQPVDIIFEDGNIAKLNFGRVVPDVTGVDQPVFGGLATGKVAENFNQFGAGVKYQFNDQISVALTFDQPYGSDIDYPLAAEGGSVALGGTRAIVDSDAIGALVRYEFNDNFSVHGGLRYQQLSADVTLQGAAYNVVGLSGYRAEFGSDGDLGYVLGAAYERPDIALRVALTYISATTHDLPTTESLNGTVLATGGVTEVETPEALQLDAQTGIAPGTLLFGSVRYARYEDTIVSPGFFNTATGGASLTRILNASAWNVGVGRELTDQLSGSISFGYENSQDNLVSPLMPTNGRQSVALGLSYDVTDTFNVSGGARYVRLGGAETDIGGTPVADFQDNDFIAFGMSLGYKF